jgi:uncharacterized membrane protein YfhO
MTYLKSKLPKPKNPLPVIAKFFRDYPEIWLSFCISFVGLLVAYLVFGIWPVRSAPNDMSVLCLDKNAQYVYYHIYMRDALFGSESMLYSWSRNFSGEFVGTIGYYLFSPFNLIAWVFPLRYITEGLLLMILTKIGFAAVAMAVYLSVWRKFSPATVVMFSVMYALSGYNMVQTMNSMWLDGVIALPLVVMGIEALLKDGKYKLLTVMLAYSFITNFYIGFMVGIFAALYFVYYALTSRKIGFRGAGLGNLKVIGKRAGVFTAVAVVSVMMAMFIILPVYASLSLGKLDFSTPDYSLHANFTMFDLTRKMFLNSYDTVRMDGLPFVFVGTLALVMLPAYLFCHRIRRVRRFGGIILMLVMAMCMIIRPIDMLWHGGQMPNWLPYRYSFTLGFLILAFGAEALERIGKVSRGVLGAGAVFFGTILMYWHRADTFVPDLGSKGRDVFDFYTDILPAAISLIVFAAFVIFAKRELAKERGDAKKKQKVGAVAFGLMCLVSIEMTFSAYNAVRSQHTDITYSTRSSFDSMHLTRQTTDELNRRMEEQGEFYRMEKTFMRSANDPMALRMRGVTHSSSMLNANALYVLRHFGYAARSHSARYWGATDVTNDLFAFRYILHGYNNLGQRQWHHGTVREIRYDVNEDVLPIAYLVDPTALDFRVVEDDVFGNQTRLLSNMLGEADNPYFVRVTPTDRRPQNVTRERYDDGSYGYKRIEPRVNAHIQFDFTAEEDGEFYLYFPTNFERRTNLWLQRYHADGSYNGAADSLGQMFETDHHHIQHIGYFTRGEKYMVTVSIPNEADIMYFRDEIFMRVDHRLLEADVARIHEMNANSTFTALSDTHLRITTNHHEERLLFTSIPLEPGWRAFVNGQEVALEGVVSWTSKEPVEERGIRDNIAEFFKQLFNIAERDDYGVRIVNETTGRRIPPAVEMHDVEQHGFIALSLPAGENEIELRFFPNMMPLGIALSIVGLAGFLLMIAVMGMFAEKGKSAKKAELAVEGDSDGTDDSSSISAILAEIGLTDDESGSDENSDAVYTGGVEDIYDGYDKDYERD